MGSILNHNNTSINVSSENVQGSVLKHDHTSSNKKANPRKMRVKGDDNIILVMIKSHDTINFCTTKNACPI